MSNKIIRSLFIPTYKFDGDIKDSLVLISRERKKISRSENNGGDDDDDDDDELNSSKRQVGLGLRISAYYNDIKYSSPDLSDGLCHSQGEEAESGDFADQILLDRLIDGDLDLDPLYKYQLNDDDYKDEDEEEEVGQEKGDNDSIDEDGGDKKIKAKELKLMVYKKNLVTNLSELVITISLKFETKIIADTSITSGSNIDYIKILKRNYLLEKDLRTQLKGYKEDNAKLTNENAHLNTTLGVVLDDAKRIKADVVDRAVELINTKKAKIRDLLKLGASDNEANSISFKQEADEEEFKGEKMSSEDATSPEIENDEDVEDDEKKVSPSTEVKLEESFPAADLLQPSSQSQIHVKQEEDTNTSADNDNNDYETEDDDSVASTEEDNSSHSTDISDDDNDDE